MTRPDLLDEVNAFRAGYRHGRDVGEVSAREAEAILRSLPTTIPPVGNAILCFCNGSVDGARGDAFRYLRSFLVI